METHVLFFLAAVLAGAINSLASGGGLITFPLLTLVMPPVAADATSAVGLVLAYPTAVWRTRHEIAEIPRRLVGCSSFRACSVAWWGRCCWFTQTTATSSSSCRG